MTNNTIKIGPSLYLHLHVAFPGKLKLKLKNPKETSQYMAQQINQNKVKGTNTRGIPDKIKQVQNKLSNIGCHYMSRTRHTSPSNRARVISNTRIWHCFRKVSTIILESMAHEVNPNGLQSIITIPIADSKSSSKILNTLLDLFL